jgi:hypothetical protein
MRQNDFSGPKIDTTAIHGIDVMRAEKMMQNATVPFMSSKIKVKG